MAKHKRPPLRQSNAYPGRQAATIQSPITRQEASCKTSKRTNLQLRVQRKREMRLPTEHPTLADRFNALPFELRGHIFSLLLVEPKKWDKQHLSTCPLRAAHPDFQLQYAPSHDAGCDEHGWPDREDYTIWRPVSRTWTNPMRSRYAPEQFNPFLCSDCYDLRVSKTARNDHILPCLCARRPNLDVLLVCRRWHTEASYILWTRNTFCFENPEIFAQMMQYLVPECRTRINSISLMSWYPPPVPEPYGAPAPVGDDSQLHPEGDEKVLRALSLLQNGGCGTPGLPSLRWLELDARWLARPRVAKKLMMKLDLSRTSVKFLLCQKYKLLNAKVGSQTVYPHLAGRTLMQGGFPAEAARRLRDRSGLRWLRAGGKKLRQIALDDAIDTFRQLLKKAEKERETWGPVYDCNDVETWRRWWYAVGHHHAWLPEGTGE